MKELQHIADRQYAYIEYLLPFRIWHPFPIPLIKESSLLYWPGRDHSRSPQCGELDGATNRSAGTESVCQSGVEGVSPRSVSPWLSPFRSPLTEKLVGEALPEHLVPTHSSLLQASRLNIPLCLVFLHLTFAFFFFQL